MLEFELTSPNTLEAETTREVVRSNILIDGDAVDKGFLRYKASNGAYETVLPDSQVNDTSENIVQNKAVHDYVESRIADVEGEIPDTSNFITKDVDDLTNYTDNTTLARTYATKGEIPDTSNFITKDVDNLTNYTTTDILERDYASKDYVETYGGKIDEIEFNGATQQIVNKKVSMNESDPTVPSWAKQQNKPTYTASEVGALPSSTKYGASFDLTLNSTTYVLTIQLKDQDGNNIGQARSVDLPLESIVVSAQYYATYTYVGTTYTKVIVITLATTSVPVIVPVGDLVSGLQTEITSSNKLSADLIADGETNKAFTATEKSKLSGIESGAEANVQPDWSQTNDTQDDYIKNKPTALANFSDDSTHRLVTDTEKNTWSGKQDAISSSNKLSADNVDDANTTNKFTTATEKTVLANIENTYNEHLTTTRFATKTWESHTWNISNFTGGNVWTRDGHLYYNGSHEYDFDSKTWKSKTWHRSDSEQAFNPNGEYIQNVGKYSFILMGAGYDFYYDGTIPDTWIKKSEWEDYDVDNCDTWSDGVNTFFYGYIFDETEKDFIDVHDSYPASYTDGIFVWTDNENIYKWNNKNLILDRTTKSWVEVSIGGTPNDFAPSHVWHWKGNTYYSRGQVQLVFNKANRTWESIDWGVPLYGYCIWTDGTSLYCDYENAQDHTQDIHVKLIENDDLRSGTDSLLRKRVDSLSSGKSVTITTTTGAESISDGTNTLNVMTRDTAQTIGGAKTFTARPTVSGTNMALTTDFDTTTWNTLNTTSKTIIGAINEIGSAIATANTSLETILGV